MVAGQNDAEAGTSDRRHRKQPAHVWDRAFHHGVIHVRGTVDRYQNQGICSTMTITIIAIIITI